jgi:hypothetical protein
MAFGRLDDEAPDFFYLSIKRMRFTSPIAFHAIFMAHYSLHALQSARTDGNGASR